MKKKKQESNCINFLTFEEKVKVNNSVKNERDQLIIELLYELGCSQNELIKIKVSDINFRENRVLIAAGKSKRPRVSSFSKSTSEIIQQHISNNKLGQNSYILCTRQSKYMTTKRVRQIVQDALKKSLGSEIKNPKILRYTHVAHAYLKNIPLAAIESQTGLTRSRMIQLFREIKVKKPDYNYANFLNK